MSRSKTRRNRPLPSLRFQHARNLSDKIPNRAGPSNSSVRLDPQECHKASRIAATASERVQINLALKVLFYNALSAWW